MPDSSPKPTHIRHLIVFVAFLSALLLYLHRFCLSFTQQFVKEDLGLSNGQFSWCLSAFFFAYALGQVPCGWMSDRFGARLMLAVYIVVWSGFTASVGFTGGFVMLLVTRIGIGLGQAGAYPTCAALVGRWVPVSSRGKANSFVAFGGRMGGFLAPVLTAYLVVSFVPSDGDVTRIQYEDVFDEDILAADLLEAREFDPDNSNPAIDDQTLAQYSVRMRIYAELPDNMQQQVGPLARRSDPDVLAHRRREGAWSGRRRHPGALHIDFVKTTWRLQPGPALATAYELQRLPVQRETRALAQLSDRTEEQTLRLNRLILEAAFPDSIRKLYAQGWRPVMWLYGAAGLLVAAVFWSCFRERPSAHPWCNAAEQQLIAAGRPTETDVGKDSGHGAVPIRAILSSRSLWLMCVNQFGGNVGWVFLLTWLPRYLLEEHSVPFVERGWMAAVPLAVGWIGMLFGGWLTDRVVKQLGLRWRTLPIVIGRFLAAVAYLSCLFVPNAWVATAAFAVIAFTNDMGNPSSWAYKQDVGGRHVGAVHGWANMWGNFGAAVSPLFLQAVISDFGWSGAFLAGSLAFTIAGVAALGVDARIPVVRNEADEIT